MHGGATDETLVTLLRKNVRTRDLTLGDLWAQVVALDTMENRRPALMDAYRMEDLRDLAEAIYGRCETRMTSANRSRPAGVYTRSLKQDRLLHLTIWHHIPLPVRGAQNNLPL